MGSGKNDSRSWESEEVAAAARRMTVDMGVYLAMLGLVESAVS